MASQCVVASMPTHCGFCAWTDQRADVVHTDQNVRCEGANLGHASIFEA